MAANALFPVGGDVAETDRHADDDSRSSGRPQVGRRQQRPDRSPEAERLLGQLIVGCYGFL